MKKILFFAIVAAITSCNSSQSNNDQVANAAVEEEIKLAPVVVAQNQQLVASFPEIYYLADDVADGYKDGNYQCLLKVDRKNAVTDTIYSILNGEQYIDAQITPDSVAIIIAEHSEKGKFSAKRYDLKNDSIVEIIPSLDDVTGNINISDTTIVVKKKVLTFYGGGSNNEYAEVENVYDYNGNIVKKGSTPSPKLTKGGYHFTGSADLGGMSGNVDLTFDVYDNGSISGSGYIWSRQRCELKGQVHGRRVEIKAYHAGRLKAKMDLSLSVSSRANSLNGTMMDDDYTFKVKTTGSKLR